MTPLFIENALVIGMTTPSDVTPGGHVLVEDGVIAALHGDAERRAREIAAAGRPLERLDARGLWLLPGFVQTHVHLCQTLLRNGPDDLPLLPWLRTHVWPGEAAHDEATLEVSARLGLAELLSGGTTAILDMGTVRHTDSVFRAAEASGLRVTSGNALMDDPATNPEELRAGTEESLEETERLAKKWHGAAGGKLRVAYCPRFAVSCTDQLLRAAAARGTAVAHCPSSNLKLASGVCPVPEYRAQGIKVTIGADGAPCNDRLDAFTEMRLAALLPKVRLGPGALSAWDVLRMATVEGASALSLPTGTLERGRRADLLLLDPGSGFAEPTTWREDPYGPIVYSMDRSHVVATFVDGISRYRRGESFPLKPSSAEIGAAVAALKRRRLDQKR